MRADAHDGVEDFFLCRPAAVGRDREEYVCARLLRVAREVERILSERLLTKIDTGTRFATVLISTSAPRLRSAIVRLGDSALWWGHAMAGAPLRT